jgi:hypothetical protein
MTLENARGFEWLCREDYSKSKTLARISHLGLDFRVVRFRSGGKPFKKYLMLLYGDMPVTNDPGPQSDVETYVRKMESAFERSYRDLTALQARLAQMTAAFDYWKRQSKTETKG